MSAPPEPVAVMTQHLGFLVEQMAEVAVVSDASRGTPPGQGIDAAVSLNFLAQSNEQQLSGPAAEAGRIPFNGTMEASETYQLFGDPPFMFFVNAGGTATTTLPNTCP